MEQGEEAYLKHLMLAEVKKIIKELYGKGAERVDIKFSGNFIFIQFNGYLRPSELNVTSETNGQAQLIASYRKAIFEGSRDEIFKRIEIIIKRKVTNCIYEPDILNNSAVCLIVLEETGRDSDRDAKSLEEQCR